MTTNLLVTFAIKWFKYIERPSTLASLLLKKAFLINYARKTSQNPIGMYVISYLFAHKKVEKHHALTLFQQLMNKEIGE